MIVKITTITSTGSEWFTYTDIADKGKSTITPVTKEDEIFLK